MREQVRLHQLQEVYRGVSRTPQRLTPVPAQAAVSGREGRDPAERVRDASVTPNAPAWFDHRILITLTDSGSKRLSGKPVSIFCTHGRPSDWEFVAGGKQILTNRER